MKSLPSSKRALLEMNTMDDFEDMSDDNVNIKLNTKDIEKPKEKEKFNLHPKVRVRLKAQREEIEFNVQIRLIEGKQFAGMQLDPVCDIHCFGDKKSSQVKEQTNTPYWDEFFVFDTIGQRDLVFDEILEFKVYSGRNLISKGKLLGTFKIDLGTIYSQPDHRFIRKFACLTNPDETLGASGAGIKGYLKVDITVLARGDPVKERPNTKDDDDVDENALLPENVKPGRVRRRFCVRIYKAEGLPKLNSRILGQIKKHYNGDARIQDLADPYVYVQFAGMEASTSVKQSSYDPEWVEEIIFCDLFPSLCRRIKIQLRDKDVAKTETIGTCWIDLSEISNDGCNVNKFNLNSEFMPTFGPTWLNLYGSTRDCEFIDQNYILNEGKEEGIGYRGRVLLAVQCEEGESATDDQIVNIHVKGAVPVSDVVGGKKDNFQLFCCIHEASMIDRNTAKKPIQFEMSIGNYGNTFDGKMLSSKDDDEEEDEDRFTHPLTDPVVSETLDCEYYNMPFYEEKPCLHLRFPWEDHRKRLYLQNMILKCVYSLEDALEDAEYLEDALKEFKENCRKLLKQLGQKVTGPKAGETKLDKERLSLIVAEIKQLMDETKQILDGLFENERLQSNYNYIFSLRDRMKKLAREPQAAIPDVFIWLLSNGKRMSYIRIQPHNIIYSPVIWESGINSGKLHTYLLTLPGKSGLRENGWAIKCKLTCVLWLGILKNKKDMFNRAPEGFDLPKELTKSTAPPPEVLKYAVSEKYILRAHAYQARGLIGSDGSGLSDAFARVIFDNQAGDTSVVRETKNPTWNQTLIFYDIVIWGSIDAVIENPPTIMIEIFDFNDGGDIEFIGRAMARPLVKRAEEPYDKPLFPPKLEWFPIYQGDNSTGELLAAFELFQITGDEEQDIHLPPPPPENVGSVFMVPDDIRPVMAPHRIECLFWGVREMKKINFQAVDQLQLEFECLGESVKSLIIPSVKSNPNFPGPWTYFDLNLPEEDRYFPPLTISLHDRSMFGKEILVGTCIVNSLLNYLQDTSDDEDEESKERIFRVIMVGEDDLKAEQEASQLKAAEVFVGYSPVGCCGLYKLHHQEEDDEDDEDEEQIDWWSRFYETIKDVERAEEEKAAALKKRKKADAKKGKKTVQLEAEEGEEEEIDTGGKKKKIINPKIIRLKIYETELEEVLAFGGFNDVLKSFTLLRGKSDGSDEEDESRIYGKFKGALKVWKQPYPSIFEQYNNSMGSFKMLPTMDPINILCRVYIVRAIDLHPTDMDGKADPYVRLQIGKQVIKDSENYVPKQLNPTFGRVFDFKVTIPHNNMLTIGVYDFDLVGTHDLIGETKIDIENRFFSKHRATCGMSVQYAINGFNKWRDPIKPTTILRRLCQDQQLDGPHFHNGKCRIDKWIFCAQEHIMDDNGNPEQSDEPSALKALHNFHMIEGKGYLLVPEHVETRPLFKPKIPGIEQGRLQLWVDLFNLNDSIPDSAIDITPRNPTSYELRCIIWNTEDVTLGDIYILTGQPCAGIYVKGWIDGIKDNKQQTDVHGTSLTGEGNFNWRFIFPFKYHKAEEKVVIIKKGSLSSWDTTEERMPPRLILNCFDSDALSSDDLLGSLVLNLTAISRPAKTSAECPIKTMNNEKKYSIFKKKLLKGWWPFILNRDDSEPEYGGKVEAQLELLTEQEAEDDPAGLGRKEPNPLPFPDRPDIMMQWRQYKQYIRYKQWEQYKFCFAKFLVIGIIFAIMGLFFYSMPFLLNGPVYAKILPKIETKGEKL